MTDIIQDAKEKKEGTFMYKFSVAFMIISVSALVLMLFLLFFPVEVIKPRVQPYRITTPIVHSGGKVAYLVDACKFINTTGKIYRSFVSDVVYSTPLSFGTVEPGCSKSQVTVNVPDDLPPGTYYLDIAITYKINILQTKSYHFKTESFKIIK